MFFIEDAPHPTSRKLQHLPKWLLKSETVATDAMKYSSHYVSCWLVMKLSGDTLPIRAMSNSADYWIWTVQVRQWIKFSLQNFTKVYNFSASGTLCSRLVVTGDSRCCRHEWSHNTYCLHRWKYMYKNPEIF